MTMRTALLAMSAMSAVAGLGISDARAEADYPICLHVYGPITYDECRYTSIEQCAPSASGRPAQCIVNPFYGLSNRPPPRRSRY